MAINKIVTKGGSTLIDLTQQTWTQGSLLQGKTAYDKSGNLVIGTLRVTNPEPSDTTNHLRDFLKGTLTEITADDLDGITYLDITVFPQFMDSYGYQKNINITKITVPMSVRYIGNEPMMSNYDSPFYFMTMSLETVDILYGTTEIRDKAFANCSHLSSVTIPESVTSIGGQAFSNCTALKELTIPSSVTYIGSNAFEYTGAGGDGMTLRLLMSSPPAGIDAAIASNATYTIKKLIIPAGSREAYETYLYGVNYPIEEE